MFKRACGFWDKWRGGFDGVPTFWMRKITTVNNKTVMLHKFTGLDMADCYHSHPGKAIRLILWGGYVEELPTGDKRR